MTASFRLLLLGALLGGCASAPPLTPWQSQPLAAALPASCATGTAPDALPASIVPGGLAIVRSAGAEMLLVATRSCVMVAATAGGPIEPLPTRGDAIAPTAVDAASTGLAFASSLSGSVRVIGADGAVAFNISGLRQPLGVRLMPGGTALVAEHGGGRVLRVGPGDESRPRMVLDGLEGPAGLAVADATTAYVSEALGGRVTAFRLDRYEKRTLAEGLARPEGLALMSDGRLVVVETGLRRLVAIDRASGRTEVLADGLPVGATGAAGAVDPHGFAGVAAAPDGTIYVSGNAERLLLRVTPRSAPAAR